MIATLQRSSRSVQYWVRKDVLSLPSKMDQVRVTRPLLEEEERIDTTGA